MLCAGDQKLPFEIAAKIETLKAEQTQEEVHRKRMGETELNAARRKDEMQTARETRARSKGAEDLPKTFRRRSQAKEDTGIHEPILEPILGQTL